MLLGDSILIPILVPHTAHGHVLSTERSCAQLGPTSSTEAYLNRLYGLALIDCMGLPRSIGASLDRLYGLASVDCTAQRLLHRQHISLPTLPAGNVAELAGKSALNCK